VPKACILPHHDTFGKGWAAQLAKLLPEAILIGIDEQTGMIDDGADGRWNVYGKGSIVLYKGGEVRTCLPGEPFSL
jgi:cyanophycinase